MHPPFLETIPTMLSASDAPPSISLPTYLPGTRCPTVCSRAPTRSSWSKMPPRKRNARRPSRAARRRRCGNLLLSSVPIERSQSRGRRRVHGAGRLNFDCHTGRRRRCRPTRATASSSTIYGSSSRRAKLSCAARLGPSSRGRQRLLWEPLVRARRRS